MLELRMLMSAKVIFLGHGFPPPPAAGTHLSDLKNDVKTAL